MRLSLIFCSILFSISVFADSNCPKADDTSSPTFCDSFVNAARCHCTSPDRPSKFCKDMNKIYNAMLLAYGSVDGACSAQKDVSKQVCIDDWQCYRNGGTDSSGNLCQGTGAVCPPVN